MDRLRTKVIMLSSRFPILTQQVFLMHSKPTMWDEVIVADCHYCHSRHNGSWLQMPGPHLNELLQQRSQCTINIIDKHSWTTTPRPELGGQGLDYGQPLLPRLYNSYGLRNSLEGLPQTICLSQSVWSVQESRQPSRGINKVPGALPCHTRYAIMAWTAQRG